ncbi:RNA-directed DNA polymerase, eukaryota [Tanacetum coccineum]
MDNLIKILKCFHLASGLRINVNKSQILGVGVPSDSVRQGALRIGCEVLQLPFKYLGVMVGDQMSRHSAWANTILKVRARLSKWKVNTLSVGGRLTLLKSVLGAVPVYNMSLYKAPVRVLHEMEMLRNKFFNGGSFQDRKITWVAWNKVLSSKKKGGLGVSSFYALNRALLLKWVWRFLSQDGSLWSQVISAIHGSRLESHSHKSYSTWGTILREVRVLASKGFDLISRCRIRVGNGSNTRFWLDSWILNTPLSVRFPRIFALETIKDISVASKWNASSFDASFRRLVRDGAENHQWLEMILMLDTVILSSSRDRWSCDINGDGVFRVKDIRSILDDLILPSSDIPTRWVKYVPIKINVFAWRARLDRLPTRGNLVNRGVLLDSTLCPNYEGFFEDVQHLFLNCDLATCISQKICYYIQWSAVSSFATWLNWFASIRLPVKLKTMLIGVFYTSWWHIWSFRNRLIFDDSPPRRSVIFDDIVLTSYTWSANHCSSLFSWETWLKNPYLISL